eukprot:TRINITY_DN6633_c0_g1_i1.p1 TRINITY_DN6633_c0_g1~~TRINITY_DN6633_c0_g1_i1.p1  ORF type:complete len:150 (+),score=16.02 TRINITY_DN6633_c0_g1_i1:186-635(+)
MAHVGPHVVTTDHNDIVLRLLAENVALNPAIASRCECAKLEWGVGLDALRGRFSDGFDVIFGSDIIFFRPSLPGLFETIDQLLSRKPGAQFITAYRERAAQTERYTLELASARGLCWHEVPLDAFVPVDELASLERVHLLVFQRTATVG